jgi:hypothetical protein
MATIRFKKNLETLFNIYSKDELLKILMRKKAFNSDFFKVISESKNLSKFNENNDYEFDIEDVKQKIKYEIGYNKKRNKIKVDISKNDVFSYDETEEELIEKMKIYIKEEQYEKAEILDDYFKKIGLKY